MDDGHLEWKEKGSQISGNGAVFLFFHSFKSSLQEGAGQGPKRERVRDSFSRPGCRAPLQQPVQDDLRSGLARCGMECRRKGMLVGNHFARNARWPSFSLWSRATLAALVNSDNQFKLEELTRISFCYLHTRCQKKVNLCEHSDLLIPGTAIVFPKDYLLVK